MEEFSLDFCRLCAERKPTSSLLYLDQNTNALNDINQKLHQLNIRNIDFSPQNRLPKTVCLTCYHSFDNTECFRSKLAKAQIMLSTLYATPPCHLKVEICSDHDHTTSSEDEEETTAMPLQVQINLKNEKLPQHNNEASTSIIPTKANYNGIPIFAKEEPEEDNQIHCKGNQNLTMVDESNIDIVNFKLKESWACYPWVCQHCLDEFSDLTQLRDHLKSHHDVCFGFRCVDCFKKICDFSVFVKHVRGHRETLRYYCEYCNLKLDCCEHANLHIKEHEKVRCYCKRCGHSFTDDASLKKHMNTYKPSKLRIGNTSKAKKNKKKPLRPPITVPLPQTELSRIRNRSWDGYPWFCKFCDVKCYDIHELREHAKTVHKTCFAMKCADCSRPMDCYISFVSHVRQHRPFLKHYCLYCNYDFKTGESDSDHLVQHFVGPNKVCDGCGEILQDRDSLLSHIAAYKPPKAKRMPNMSKERPLTLDDLTCDVCGKIVSTLGALKAHKLLHTERKKDHTCEKCGKAFFRPYNLSLHMVLHEDKRSFICEICDKGFNTRPQLKAHVLTHSGEKPFECHICKRLFRLRRQLKQHSIIHTNLMLFQCEYCDKSFKHKTNWRTHQNQHTGQRPYRCTECNMGFASWSNCNKHMIRRHSLSYAKTKLTPLGKLPINQRTGEPKVIKNLEEKRDWTQQLLMPKIRRRNNPQVHLPGTAIVGS